MKRKVKYEYVEEHIEAQLMNAAYGGCSTLEHLREYFKKYRLHGMTRLAKQYPITISGQLRNIIKA